MQKRRDPENKFIFDTFYPKQIDECFKEKLEIVGDTYKGTSCAAGKTIKQSWKLDEETCMEGKSSFCYLNDRKMGLLNA